MTPPPPRPFAVATVFSVSGGRRARARLRHALHRMTIEDSFRSTLATTHPIAHAIPVFVQRHRRPSSVPSSASSVRIPFFFLLPIFFYSQLVKIRAGGSNATNVGIDAVERKLQPLVYAGLV